MKKSEWGPIVWNLLHCIACKIKPDFFALEKGNILKMISGICQNLPCPTCATHASSIIRKYKDSMLLTKDDLIKMILILHNTVNRRLKKNIYNIKDLTIYDKKCFKDVLIEYYIMMKKSNYSEKMILNSFHKSEFLKIFYKYFASNMSNFLK